MFCVADGTRGTIPSTTDQWAKEVPGRRTDGTGGTWQRGIPERHQGWWPPPPGHPATHTPLPHTTHAPKGLGRAPVAIFFFYPPLPRQPARPPSPPPFPPILLYCQFDSSRSFLPGPIQEKGTSVHLLSSSSIAHSSPGSFLFFSRLLSFLRASESRRTRRDASLLEKHHHNPPIVTFW